MRELNELNFVRFDAKLEQRVTQLDARIDRLESSVDATLDRLRAELVKWMFLFWLGTVGLVLTLVTQLR